MPFGLLGRNVTVASSPASPFETHRCAMLLRVGIESVAIAQRAPTG